MGKAVTKTVTKIAMGIGKIVLDGVLGEVLEEDGCYPGDMEVVTLDASTGVEKIVQVADLEKGMQVLTANYGTHSLQFEPLLLDFHPPQENTKGDVPYLRLLHHAGSIDISPSH